LLRFIWSFGNALNGSDRASPAVAGREPVGASAMTQSSSIARELPSLRRPRIQPSQHPRGPTPPADAVADALRALHDGPPATRAQRRYVPVRRKWLLVLGLAISWMSLSIFLSQRWLAELSVVLPLGLTIFVIAFIAYVPGFMNAFLIGSIAFDRRPHKKQIDCYPDLSVLVACYNEQDEILDTLQSLARQRYPGRVEVLIIDDGSTDDTARIAREAAAAMSRDDMRFIVVSMGKNGGKARALNRGLARSTASLVVTIDGDSWIYEDSLKHIVQRFLSDPNGTVAVAGAVLVRNSRDNWLARAQEWDYFHGIAAVKRMQSMYHGTLVAQGAFSLYTRAVLDEVGGWPDCVGEDIVLTWAMLSRGYRIGYCEDACIFTTVPASLGQFARQRQRWSRGMLEAFERYWPLLFKRRLSTLFIWWNLLFLPMDLVYTLAFLPGVIMALFGYYYIAGLMTLLVLPLAVIWNLLIFRVQASMFKTKKLRVRNNIRGFLIYVLGYTAILQPVCLWGYITELLRFRKTWGTK
jgi:poly-beta-1,6-N-acetyl-D-glucosamine synthase